MSSMADVSDSQVFSRARRKPVVPNGVLGMIIFILTEIMFFAGLISAHTIARGAATRGWPPPGQPRLPVEETAFNTVALLLSGVALFVAGRMFAKNQARSGQLLLVAMLLGTVFVGFQGAEWLALIREGLTMTTSTHGSFFYLIVGTHAAHAVVALMALGYVYLRHRRGTLERSALLTAELFWYFVVLVWPVLYARVYLG